MADRVALIDYGAGNLHSVHNALRAVGAADVAVTDDPALVRAADRIVLPGVGAFAACMNGLSAIPGMIDALEDRVRGDRVPFLGICVGMQLLATRGLEHATHAGLGWIAGEVRAMDATPSIKVPHMGWNDVTPSDGAPLIVPGEAYFLHSYHFAAADADDVAAVTDHGGPVTAAVARGNILGVQFHPEKSQAYGLDLLRRFLDWTVS
ncbi:MULTISPECIES: imidazole glycerol phosphate synthase subunit HisH [Pseudomonadota]|uniref:imidazole glycerol phosphate synthase subunit HisH n=1 Tax=Pseudomonadota TaxID=1224 RepID=UPI00076A187C|nr:MULTISPECIES: imidazole glycerol phosphate synthase subunit HisH [Pseudomonadota]